MAPCSSAYPLEGVVVNVDGTCSVATGIGTNAVLRFRIAFEGKHSEASLSGSAVVLERSCR